MSIIQAVNEVLGHEKVQACFFHLCQNVHKHVVREGLKAVYEDETDVCLYAFLKELQKEQSDAETIIRQLQLGQKVRKGQSRQRRKYEEQIFNIVSTYEVDTIFDTILYRRMRTIMKTMNVLSYLKNIGHNIKI